MPSPTAASRNLPHGRSTEDLVYQAMTALAMLITLVSIFCL